LRKRAVIFANGDLRDVKNIKAQIGAEDFLIAADGGFQHLISLGLIPDLVIGDLDSMPDSVVRQLQDDGVELLRFPPEKNETDLELALLEAAARDYHNLLIVAGLGGRLDQTLGNFALIRSPGLARCQVKMDDGVEEVWNLKGSKKLGELQIFGKKGEVVSLLAIGSRANGINTEGLKFPLAGDVLFSYQTRGISNEMLGPVARVTLSEGELIVIHTRQVKK
jgi:thiamine pyrophosphokinase